MAQLPEELLSLICAQLSSHAVPSSPGFSQHWDAQDGITRTLYSLCQTSKSCHRVARPQLYRTLDFGRHKYRRIRPVLRALLTSPELRNAVTEVRLNYWTRSWIRDYAESEDEDYGFVADDLEPGVRAGSNEAEIALFLSACPNIRLLSFELIDKLGMANETAAEDSGALRVSANTVAELSKVKPLQRLRDMVMEDRGSDSSHLQSVRFEELGPVLRLPSLRNLYGWDLEIHGERLPSHIVPSMLKSLVLTNGCVDAWGLRLLLESCSSLERLSLAWSDCDVCNCTILFRAIAATIVRHGRNLSHLTISSGEGPALVGELGSLRKAAQLTSVCMPDYLLYGHVNDQSTGNTRALSGLLPLTMVYLEISEDNDPESLDLDKLIWEDLIREPELFPHLRGIVIHRCGGRAFHAEIGETDWVDLTDSGRDGSRVVLRRNIE